MKFGQIFIICLLFFASALSDEHQHKAKPEPVSNAEQEYKNEINSLKKELENIRKEQSTIQQQHKHMSESIQQIDKLVKQSETLNDQVKKLQHDIGELQKTDTETNKELNKVSQTINSFTDSVKKLDEKISKQFSSLKSQFEKSVQDAKSQAKTFGMKLQEIEEASFLNVASQSLSNAYEVGSTYVRSVDWSRLSDPVFWNNFREYSAESYENSKQFVYEQLIPAFQKQAVGQYNHARGVFNNLYTQLHKHELFHRALKEGKPYLVMVNIPPQYHEYTLDVVIALLFIINLFILYLFFLLFCGLLCPRVRVQKESSTDDSAKLDKNDDNDKNDASKTKSKSTDENNNTTTTTTKSTNTKEKKKSKH